METNCYLCGGTGLIKLYQISQYSVVKCLNCSFVYTSPLPLENELYRYYDKFDYSDPKAAEEVIRKDARRSLSILERLSDQYGRLLDVGCGRGFLLDEARHRGWLCYGIDYSQKTVSYGRDVLKLNVKKADIFTYRTAQKFDVVVLNQVIEHTSKPKVLLEKCYHLLRRGGIVYIATPNIESISARVMKRDFDHLIPPEHLSYFSKKTLTCLLKEIGFKPIYIGSWSYPADLAGVIKYVLKVRKDKQIKHKNNSTTQGRRIDSIKKLKYFLFDKLFCNTFYRILNLNCFGINLEVVAIKL